MSGSSNWNLTHATLTHHDSAIPAPTNGECSGGFGRLSTGIDQLPAFVTGVRWGVRRQLRRVWLAPAAHRDSPATTSTVAADG